MIRSNSISTGNLFNQLRQNWELNSIKRIKQQQSSVRTEKMSKNYDETRSSQVNQRTKKWYYGFNEERRVKSSERIDLIGSRINFGTGKKNTLAIIDWGSINQFERNKSDSTQQRTKKKADFFFFSMKKKIRWNWWCSRRPVTTSVKLGKEKKPKKSKKIRKRKYTIQKKNSVTTKERKRRDDVAPMTMAMRRRFATLGPCK